MGSPAPTAPPAAGERAEGWTLTPRGAGPVRFGMTLAEVRAAVDGELETLGPPGECSYVRAPGAPPGLAFMIFAGRVVRADVLRGSGVATSVGVHTGQSEQQARALLGPQTEVRQHHYLEQGHYLSASTGEGSSWWVVETDGDTVTDLRAGLQPQVRWIEGCA